VSGDKHAIAGVACVVVLTR